MKTHTALYSPYMAVPVPPPPPGLPKDQIKSYIQTRNTQEHQSSRENVYVFTKKNVKYTSNLYITSIKMLTINLQALHSIDYI